MQCARFVNTRLWVLPVVRRIQLGAIAFAAATLLMALLFPSRSRAEDHRPPPCPPSALQWVEACAHATSTHITLESCPDHRVILETASSFSSHLRVEIAPSSKGFRQVRDISVSPIGTYEDWNAAPDDVRQAFDRIVQCAQTDMRIDGALTDVQTMPPPPEQPTEYPRFMKSPHAAWSWLLLFVFVAMAFASIATKRSRALTFLLVGSAAFAARMLSAHYPANWYSDLCGPKGAVSEVFIRRGGGYAGFFQLLAEWISIEPFHIFAFSALCSSLAIALLMDVVLLHAIENRRRVSRMLPFFCGVFLVFDPRMRYLGASDAAHNVAVFSFAVTFWFYCDLLGSRGAKSSRRATNGLVIVVSSLLTGMTRPELLAGVATVPFLAALYRTAKPRRHVLPIACAMIGMCIVAYEWSGRPMGVRLEPATKSQILRWFDGSTPALLYIPWLLLVIDSIRRKSMKPLLLILAYYIAAAPRIPTGFASGTYTSIIDEAIAAIRYDAISHLILLLSIAHGFAALEAMLGRIDKPAWKNKQRAVGLGAALVFGYAWSGFTTSGAHRFPRSPASFQLEYEFLSRALPLLPKHSTVATVWDDHFPSRTADPDAGMAWPAALLSYLRPDIKFVVINPKDLLTVPRGAYVFTGAMCSLDVNVLDSFVPAEDVEYMRQLVTICRRLTDKTRPIAEVSDERPNVADRRFGRDPMVLTLRILPEAYTPSVR